MLLSEIGEKGLIDRINRKIQTGQGVIRGIGDDCAVLVGPPGWYQLFASDMLVEGVHFLKSAPAQAIGWKALAVNISDIAAMGGLPRHAVISLGLPGKTKVSFVDGLYRGLTRCAKRFKVNLVGGDTDRSEKIVIDVAILGEVERSRVVYRSGAKMGDAIFVTGQLGGSLRSGGHLTFSPRLKDARALVERWKIHAMIDLSDGLYPDCARLCEASGVAAWLEAHAIPRRRGCTLRQAFTDGEDFELLFTVGERDAGRILSWGRRYLPCGLSMIGRIVKRQGPTLVKGVYPSLLSGFQHF